MRYRLTLFLILVAVLASVIFGMQNSAVAEVDDTDAVTSNPNWQTPTLISTNSLGGKLPTVTASPTDSSDVMVAYLQQFNSSTVPYYRSSTNNGNSWTTAQPIATNASNESGVAVDIAYDNSGNAHAIWSTLTTNATEVHKVYYARDDSWPGSTFFSQVANPGLIINPTIAARGNIVVLVWAESASDPITDLYYRFSTANGSGMTSKAIVEDTLSFSRKPDIEMGSGNRIHLVWQEGDSGLYTSIQYSQGTIQGNSITWSSSITLAEGGTPPNPTRSETLTPQIDVKGNRVIVSFTRWNNISNDFSQRVEYRECAQSCANINNWTATTPVSGQFLGETSNNPFSVKSTVARVGGCSYVYFHGIPLGQLNQQILGVNSCSNWFASGRDQVTSQSEASINPKIESHNDWFIYLVYEDVADDLDRTRNVYFVRNNPALYLPAILR